MSTPDPRLRLVTCQYRKEVHEIDDECVNVTVVYDNTGDPATINSELTVEDDAFDLDAPLFDPPKRIGNPLYRQTDLDAAYARGISEGRAKASAFIANEIRAELVCCDVYERLTPLRARMEAAADGGISVSVELDHAIGEHDICYWGEAAARIADPWTLAEEAPDA